MPDDATYNGWKNYETWAVGMYLDGNYDGEGTYLAVLDLVRETAERARATTLADDPTEVENLCLYDVESALKDWFEENLPDLGASIAMDLLNAAVSEVDWRRLAEHKLQEISETVS